MTSRARQGIATRGEQDGQMTRKTAQVGDRVVNEKWGVGTVERVNLVSAVVKFDVVPDPREIAYTHLLHTGERVEVKSPEKVVAAWGGEVPKEGDAPPAEGGTPPKEGGVLPTQSVQRKDTTRARATPRPQRQRWTSRSFDDKQRFLREHGAEILQKLSGRRGRSQSNMKRVAHEYGMEVMAFRTMLRDLETVKGQAGQSEEPLERVLLRGLVEHLESGEAVAPGIARLAAELVRRAYLP